jgi:hypothetical protein
MTMSWPSPSISLLVKNTLLQNFRLPMDMILKDGKAWTKLEDTRRGKHIKKEIDKYLLSF